MFAVVFEVRPEEGRKGRYLDLAQHLKPMLEETDGFVSVERFESRRRPGWMLSLSLWRDEKSVVRWRSQGEHHAIQLQGRAQVFTDYHLRVGEVTSDSGAAGLPQQHLDETEIGAAKSLGVTEIEAVDEKPAAAGVDALAAHVGLDLHDPALVDHDVFESLATKGKLLLLTGWRTAGHATAWTPRAQDGTLRHRTIRSVRDYGLLDRREAPQFCPMVRRKEAAMTGGTRPLQAADRSAVTAAHFVVARPEFRPSEPSLCIARPVGSAANEKPSGIRTFGRK